MESLELVEFYRGKKIFVTGHTGFKGGWLSWWLKRLGAIVLGYSLAPENIRGSFFHSTGLDKEINSCQGDVRDSSQLKKALEEFSPDIVFHLAAQAIVIRGYEDPINTYVTNVIGTVNLLEACRHIASVKTVVVATSDKCYANKESGQAYCEIDTLGGHDPYSSSKAMAELAVHSYQKSFYASLNKGLASVRAGNVLGGGDFGAYRLVPDIIEAVEDNHPLMLRFPKACRPWQHILDALYGYLTLGLKLWEEPQEFSTAFNFGPDDRNDPWPNERLARDLLKRLGRPDHALHLESPQMHEANVLRLDSSKARQLLGWHPRLKIEETLEYTAAWYRVYLQNNQPLNKLTVNQIESFESLKP